MTKFRPNKKDGGVSNKTRAERIDKVLPVYAKALGESRVDETTAQDMLTDLMHWCDKEKQDFQDMLRMAEVNWSAER